MVIGGVSAQLVVGSKRFAVARVPDTGGHGRLTVSNGELESEPVDVAVGIQLAEGLHPVANPAVDLEGNIYTTFSGSRGQKTAVAVYKIDVAGVLMPFVPELMNASGLAFDREGVLHVSSRFDGVIYQVNHGGVLTVYVEGMGVATGIAFDANGNLFVGDRAGTIFKISPERQIYVFATLEPSIAAYHLAFGPDGSLFVTGPTTSSHDTPCSASTRRARWRSTIAGSAGRGWRSIAPATSTWRRRSADARGSWRDHAGARGVAVPLRLQHRGAGLRAERAADRNHDQRSVRRGRGRRGRSASLRTRHEMTAPGRAVESRCRGPWGGERRHECRRRRPGGLRHGGDRPRRGHVSEPRPSGSGPVKVDSLFDTRL